MPMATEAASAVTWAVSTLHQHTGVRQLARILEVNDAADNRSDVQALSKILPRLPQGVNTELGPDVTGVGWVYQYALVDTTGKRNLAELRSLQDWYLRYYLQAVPGVAEGALRAAGVGWVYQYALVDTTGKRNLAELRSLQDWYLRYYLQAVPGVAEVAP